jgi:hypothetical protein
MKSREQSGQVLVGVALAMVAIMGFAGLAMDMGTLRYQKRLEQTAADAAAIAGALNLGSSFGGVVAGGQAAASADAFTDNNNAGGCTGQGVAIGCISIAINNPPLYGPHTADSKYVEAIVSAVQPTFFMNIFGVSKELVVARAVATDVSGGGPYSGCLYALGPPSSSIEGVNINGNATLNAPTCGINDNGNFNTKGNALTVNAGSFGVSGDPNQSGPGGHVTCTDPQATCPVYGVPASADPLSYLTPPTQPAAGTVSGSTYSPGTYNGISLTGSTNVTFSPGIYYMTGDFTCHGTPTIQGTGVMFYFTNGATWNCSGNDTVNLSAPTSGTYQGILLYQDPADTSGPTIGGNVGSTFAGTVYFPKSQITFFGNSSSVSIGMAVGDSFALSGHPTVNLLGQAGLPAGVTVLKHAILVE